MSHGWELEYAWRLETTESSQAVYDHLEIRLNDDVTRAYVATIRRNTNHAPRNVWTVERILLAGYLVPGRKVFVEFTVHTDGSLPTTFFVDDVPLRATDSPGGSTPGTV